MTSLADTEAQIVADLTTIRDLWDSMLPTIKAIPLGHIGGGASRTSTAKDVDNSDANTGVDNLDVVVSDRGDITAILQGWARLVVEDFDVTTVIPHGHDVHGMAQFLQRWTRHMTGHVACEDFASEVHDCARLVLRHARPTRKDWLGIGVCPLRNDETGEQCGGNIRAYPDSDAGESWATCQACGVRAVVSWWEHEIFGGEATTLVTAAELRLFVRHEFGRPVGDSTIRTWIRRGWIEASGKDAEGRTLYDKGAVAYALQRRHAV